jgi:hypothetical protein
MPNAGEFLARCIGRLLRVQHDAQKCLFNS